jgi:quercetin 2,3-dioxygenase
VTFEIRPSHLADVAGTEVRRALPQRGRRTVGPWCFADHFGPAEVRDGMQIGPHPHIGLQTVTWLVEGGLVHHDSLGTEQPVRPGQLNLMTAGWGIAHSEESPWKGEVTTTHGIQLWVAQPDATRDGEPAFEHHAELPQVALGAGTATVLVGSMGGVRSPARHDWPQLGAEVVVPDGGTAAMDLDPAFEHAVIVLSGTVAVAGEQEGGPIAVGALGHLGTGRDEVALQAVGGEPARLVLLGGSPFEAEPYMKWNFVGRTSDEVRAAAEAWNGHDDERFGPVPSALPRIPAPT